MKKIAGALCLSLIALAACDNGKKDNGRIELESYSYDCIQQLTDSVEQTLEETKYWRSVGHGVLPVSIGGESVEALRDTLQAMGQVVFTPEGKATPETSVELTPTDLDPLKTDACSTSTNELCVWLVTPKVIVWEDYASYYPCRAAHGRYATTYLNYSLVDHKILTLNDIFKPGYRGELVSLLKEKLQENPDVFDGADITVPDVFCITSEGIKFVYGIYSIAPYSAGEISVPFQYYEIDHLLSPLGESLIGSGF